MKLELRKNLIILSIVFIVLGAGSIMASFAGYLATIVVSFLTIAAVIISMVLIRKIRKANFYFEMAFVWMWLFLCFLIIALILILALIPTLQEIAKIVTEVCEFAFFICIIKGFIYYLRPKISIKSEKIDKYIFLCYLVFYSIHIVLSIIIERLEVASSVLLSISTFIEVLGNASFIAAALILLIQIKKYGQNETKECIE